MSHRELPGRCDIRIGLVLGTPRRSSFQIFFLRLRPLREFQPRFDCHARGLRVEARIAIHVDVGTLRDGYTPKRHCSPRVKLRSLSEGAQSLVAIEAEYQCQSLIEVFLRLRTRCRNRMMPRAEPRI